VPARSIVTTPSTIMTYRSPGAPSTMIVSPGPNPTVASRETMVSSTGTGSTANIG
jgi:hypothetical protein